MRFLTVSSSLVVWHKETKTDFSLRRSISSLEGGRTLSVMSALFNNSFEEFIIVAPELWYASSELNDFNPAPDST